ncbi:MAG: MCE family protein [Planctomycetota bacterium]|nr:MAG: MCE family protein [Planctomycetota bacterium]
MAASNTSRDFVLGLLFFSSIVLLLYITIALTGFSLRERSYLDVWFSNARGLKSGDAVLVSGRATGTVREVEYLDGMPEDRRIRVRLEFEDPVRLHQDYVIAISEFTLLGGRVVEIDPGSLGQPLVAEGAELIGTVGPSALESLGQMVVENRDDLRAVLQNLRQTTEDVNSGKGILGALINDAELRADFDAFVADARQLAADVREGKGILGLLISDPAKREEFGQLLTKATDAVTNLTQIAEDLRGGRGLLGALLTDEAMAAEGRELISNLTDTAVALRKMVEDAEQGQGLLGQLIADEQLAADAEAFLDNLAEVTRRLREGEGSLGQLLATDETYNQLRDALNTLNRALEDEREAQPISAFASLLFGAF